MGKRKQLVKPFGGTESCLRAYNPATDARIQPSGGFVIIIIIIKYSIYIAPYSQSALWRCILFLELFKKIKDKIKIKNIHSFKKKNSYNLTYTK